VDLKQLLASESALTPAVAADQVDRVVADILRRLREGNTVALPGVGVLRSDTLQRVKLQPIRRKNKGDRR
jgi:nucleoid DNA-binding protein